MTIFKSDILEPMLMFAYAIYAGSSRGEGLVWMWDEFSFR